MTTTQPTYHIEVREDGRWIPAPGESTGWTLPEAERAIAGPIYGLDGSTYDPTDVRIVAE